MHWLLNLTAHHVNNQLTMKVYKMNYSWVIVVAVFCFFPGCSHEKRSAENTGNSGLTILSVKSANPLFTNFVNNDMVNIEINSHDSGKNISLKKITLNFDDCSAVSDIEAVKVINGTSKEPSEQVKSFESYTVNKKRLTIRGEYNFIEGRNTIIINIAIKENADLAGTLKLEEIKFILEDNTILSLPGSNFPVFRFAKILRAAGQDSCNTYRIPGLITTNKGTLIAVYDNRYNSDKDLQEDIDIGMSRSTDYGQTWEPMKVIIDMGEYGGRSQRHNGIGDPCVLYDHITGTIWVAALWMSGSSPDQMVWMTSKPGILPEETGQFILVQSTDDGVTWSTPINITEQIKDPSWQLMLQGPGRGITMQDGTLVFPAQYKVDTGEKSLTGNQYTPFSTIVYSKDGGKNWHIGTGAKPNTTEAQVVELTDGRLMLNMRDDINRNDTTKNNGRAVMTTDDFGKSWNAHPSSNSALPEPNCMASIISSDINISGMKRKVLFFSNPDNRKSRSNMTIKASMDEGLTWPKKYHVQLSQEEGYGYSCLTMVDENTVGILYEGIKELYFQKIHVKDILQGIQ